MTPQTDPEDALLREVALQNLQSIRVARQRAEDQLAVAQEALHEETRVLELLNRTGAILASSLEHEAIVQTVTDAATELSGAEFGAFFYNVIDESGEAFQLFTLSGAPRAAFEQFGEPRATALFGPTLRGEPSIRSDDLLHDSRYAEMALHFGMPKEHLPVRSYLAVPVRSRTSDVIGGLFFGHSNAGCFSDRTERLVVGIASQAGIAMDNARLFEATQKAAIERTELLESERAARAAAERLSDVKDEFLATLSHELRTPLNAILGWAHVLRTTAGDDTDMARGLDTILRNSRMQAQMIEDLLDMSRITSGKLRLDVQSVYPISFVEAAIETVKPAADAKGVRLEALLDAAAGPISGDPSRLQQVVWNLLSNAIKFTPKGGKVQVLLERINSHIEISVADTGAGIRPEMLPHLFDRFRQGDASTTREYGGLGLGLSIVKSLVELHGGTVMVSSAGEEQGDDRDGVPALTGRAGAIRKRTACASEKRVAHGYHGCVRGTRGRHDPGRGRPTRCARADQADSHRLRRRRVGGRGSRGSARTARPAHTRHPRERHRHAWGRRLSTAAADTEAR